MLSLLIMLPVVLFLFSDIYAIGVTGDVNTGQLREIVGEDGEYFTVNQFEDLSNLLGTVQICDKPTSPLPGMSMLEKGTNWV